MNRPQPYKNISAFKLNLLVVFVISLFFPVIFAYINKEFTWSLICREWIFTTLRLIVITVMSFGLKKTVNFLVKAYQNHLLRYVLELPLVLFITYQWLLFFVMKIEILVRDPGTIPKNDWVFRQYIGLYFIATIFIYVFQSGLNFYQIAQQKALEAEKLQQDHTWVKMMALKNQVNPHFLFNSLSVLSELVHVDAEVSEKFIVQLSRCYRYILDQKDVEWVSLKSELEFLDSYFFLLQIRFANKIELIKNINLDIADYKLPPLTLQLLVENAVKHNKMSSTEPLKIRVFNQDAYLLICNNIDLRENSQDSTGIGLDNVRQRFAYLSNRKVLIDQGTDKFMVSLPLVHS
jgi:two-component system LytT family sensor kinase